MTTILFCSILCASSFVISHLSFHYTSSYVLHGVRGHPPAGTWFARERVRLLLEAGDNSIIFILVELFLLMFRTDFHLLVWQMLLSKTNSSTMSYIVDLLWKSQSKFINFADSMLQTSQPCVQTLKNCVQPDCVEWSVMHSIFLSCSRVTWFPFCLFAEPVPFRLRSDSESLRRGDCKTIRDWASGRKGRMNTTLQHFWGSSVIYNYCLWDLRSARCCLLLEGCGHDCLQARIQTKKHYCTLQRQTMT